MSLVGFKAKNHPQQRAKDVVDDRALPPEDFVQLDERFRFTVDVAAAPHNRKKDRFYSIENSGLEAPWKGERVYCNPPYSRIRPWVEKAWAEDQCPLVVMLLPANRTEQKWWQDLIEPHRDRPGSPLRTEFLFGRLRFIKAGMDEVEPNNRPPFGCVLCIWERPEAKSRII